MRVGRVFWGTLFIVVGVVFLLERFNVLSWEWDYAWKLWPLALVFLGIAVIVKNQPLRWILAVLAGLVLAFLVLSILSFNWPCGITSSDRTPVSQELAESFDPVIKRAVLAVDGAAGTFTIGDTTDQLLRASTRSNMVTYDLKVERGSDSTEAWLKLRETGVKWRGHRGQNRAEIRLNDRPSWEIDLDVGAAKLDADLTAFVVTKVSIDAGASSIHLKLGTRAERTDVRVDAGASSIRIAVPESVGCEVRLDGALSSKHLDGFQSVGSGKHRTENYESSNKKISIVIDAGVSSIRVSRY